MKRLAAILLAALLLTGCNAVPSPPDNNPQKTNASGSDYTEVNVKLSDGRTVLCLRPMNGTSATSSCDWEHAK